MIFRPIALWTVLAAGLAAQGDEAGFQWLALRAGAVNFDPLEDAKGATFNGGQAGMLFSERRFGVSIEGFASRPKSSLFPDLRLSHTEASVTFLSGLSGNAASSFWPYLGLGLGLVSSPKVAPTTLVVTHDSAAALHASFGFLHRPVRGLIWGMEGRYLVSFLKKADLNELQGSVLLGVAWGGRASAPAPAAPSPAPEAKAPAPPPPSPAAPAAPAAPPPVVAVAPAPPSPEPAPVKATPPPAAPAPSVSPAPSPIPTAAPVLPPAPVALPAPVPAAPAKAATRPPAAASGPGPSLAALRAGDLAQALEAGRRRIQAIPPRHWTIRLEVADLVATLKSAAAAFPADEPDLFIAPLRFGDGRVSYQVFLGAYATKAEAERAAKAVPAFFREGGQRPRLYAVADIPARAGGK